METFMPVEKVDQMKLGNLIARRKIYGDITQNVTESDLEKLLRYYENDVPKVIDYNSRKVRIQGKRILIPPAFYERDGTLFQPPPIEMKCWFVLL